MLICGLDFTRIVGEVVEVVVVVYTCKHKYI